jgi:hypothetical protein
VVEAINKHIYPHCVDLEDGSAGLV